MNNTINTTEKATMPEAVAPATEAFAAVESLPCDYVTMTISDYLDSDTCAPEYQRPYVWKDSQATALIDSVVNGYPLPAIIIADIPRKDCKLSLLIDGVQRTATLRQYIDSVDANNQYESDKLDYVLSAPITLQRITCPDAATAAALFVRYNNGSALNGIQRAKAALPSVVLSSLAPYIRWAQDFHLSKMGSVTPDTAAMMIAAAVINSDKATSAGASAGKVLSSVDHVPPMPTACAMVQDAITMCADDDITAYWTAPARLVPLVMSVNDAHADSMTADTLADFLRVFNPMDTAKYSVMTVGRGKNPVTKKTPMSIARAMADRGNGHGATNARYCVIRGALEAAHKDAPETAQDRATKAIEAALAEV